MYSIAFSTNNSLIALGYGISLFGYNNFVRLTDTVSGNLKREIMLSNTSVNY